MIADSKEKEVMKSFEDKLPMSFMNSFQLSQLALFSSIIRTASSLWVHLFMILFLLESFLCKVCFSLWLWFEISSSFIMVCIRQRIMANISKLFEAWKTKWNDYFKSVFSFLVEKWNAIVFWMGAKKNLSSPSMIKEFE